MSREKAYLYNHRQSNSKISKQVVIYFHLYRNHSHQSNKSAGCLNDEKKKKVIRESFTISYEKKKK